MRNKRLISWILCGMLVLSCAGCRLARPESETAGEDRFIGVFVTWDYLDLFDFEGYFSDNADKIMNGDEISLQESAAYQGRVYAHPMVRSDGSSFDFVFDDLNGVGFYVYKYEDAAGAYNASHIDSGMTGNGTHYNVTDEGESVELDGTIYMTPQSTLTIHANPVYQAPDGNIYVTAGSGGFSSDIVNFEGEIFSTTLDETTTVTENGQSKTMGCKVTVRVAVMFEPKEIVVIQMDENSRELNRQSYDPGSMPETLTLDAACAYVITETHKLDADGQYVITRELVNLTDDADYLTTFHARDDGVCVQQDTELITN